MPSRRIQAFFCCFLFVVCLGDSWQSYGNFTQDNMTFIRATLAAVTPELLDSFWKPEYDPLHQLPDRTLFSKNISETLNSVWGGGWNTIILYQALGVGVMRSIVYGYAFNGHWLWLNDYTRDFSIIIWKDYNCNYQGVISAQKNEDQGMAQATKTVISAKADEIVAAVPSIFNDPWEFGHQLVSKLDAINASQAFTVFVSDEKQYHYGYCCMVLENQKKQVQSFILSSSVSPYPMILYTVLRMR